MTTIDKKGLTRRELLSRAVAAGALGYGVYTYARRAA